MISWFHNSFGFNEKDPGTFNAVRNKFELLEEEHQTILHSKSNGSKFAVGRFETPSVEELHQLFSKIHSEKQRSTLGHRFENITGEVRALILNPNNAGAVFQAASQFNCLEMVGPSITPEKGVTGYC